MQDKEPILFESQFRFGRQYLQEFYRMSTPKQPITFFGLAAEVWVLAVIAIALLKGHRPSNTSFVLSLVLPPLWAGYILWCIHRATARTVQSNLMIFGEEEPLVLLQVTESGIRSIFAGTDGDPFISFEHIRKVYRRGPYLFFRLANNSFIAANFGNITTGSEAELLAFLRGKGVCGL